MKKLYTLLSLIVILFALPIPTFAAGEPVTMDIFPEDTTFVHPPVENYTWDPDGITGSLNFLYMLSNFLILASGFLIKIGMVIFQSGLHPEFFGDILAGIVTAIKESDSKIRPIFFGLGITAMGFFLVWDYLKNNQQRAMKRATSMGIVLVFMFVFYQTTVPGIKMVTGAVDATSTAITGAVVSISGGDVAGDLGSNPKESFQKVNQFLMGKLWKVLVEDPWQMGEFGEIDGVITEDEADSLNDSMKGGWFFFSDDNAPTVAAGTKWKDFVLQYPPNSDYRGAVVEYFSDNKTQQYEAAYSSSYRLLLATLSFLGSIVVFLFFLIFGGLMMLLYLLFLAVFLSGIVILPMSLIPFKDYPVALKGWIQWLGYATVGKIGISIYVGLVFLVTLLVHEAEYQNPSTDEKSILVLILINVCILLIGILLFVLILYKLNSRRAVLDSYLNRGGGYFENQARNFRNRWGKGGSNEGSDYDDDDANGRQKIDSDRVDPDSSDPGKSVIVVQTTPTYANASSPPARGQADSQGDTRASHDAQSDSGRQSEPAVADPAAATSAVEATAEANAGQGTNQSNTSTSDDIEHSESAGEGQEADQVEGNVGDEMRSSARTPDAVRKEKLNSEVPETRTKVDPEQIEIGALGVKVSGMDSIEQTRIQYPEDLASKVETDEKVNIETPDNMIRVIENDLSETPHEENTMEQKIMDGDHSEDPVHEDEVAAAIHLDGQEEAVDGEQINPNGEVKAAEGSPTTDPEEPRAERKGQDLEDPPEPGKQEQPSGGGQIAESLAEPAEGEPNQPLASIDPTAGRYEVDQIEPSVVKNALELPQEAADIQTQPQAEPVSMAGAELESEDVIDGLTADQIEPLQQENLQIEEKSLEEQHEDATDPDIEVGGREASEEKLIVLEPESEAKSESEVAAAGEEETDGESEVDDSQYSDQEERAARAVPSLRRQNSD